MTLIVRYTAITCAVFILGLSALVQADESFGTKDPGLMQLRGAIYFLAPDTEKMPADLEARRPEGFIYAARLDLPTREFTEGFPGVTNRFEWFGLLYKGTIQVTKPGPYGWRLNSDDGSRLWIDGKEVIDNDGIHGTVDASGTTELGRGPHDVKVWFFQGPATELALQLFVTTPGQEEKIFDMVDFRGDLAGALGRVNAEATAEGIRVRLESQVLFDTGKFALKPAAQAVVADVARVIASYPGCLVRVEGHTDAQGDDATNGKLSLDRAEAVRAALSATNAAGVRYETRGFGKTRPIAPNDSPEGRAKNRRVEITIVPK
jgi:outer membrane protein OmpA-like peptidoglycan-associated protein